MDNYEFCIVISSRHILSFPLPLSFPPFSLPLSTSSSQSLSRTNNYLLEHDLKIVFYWTEIKTLPEFSPKWYVSDCIDSHVKGKLWHYSSCFKTPLVSCTISGLHDPCPSVAQTLCALLHTGRKEHLCQLCQRSGCVQSNVLILFYSLLSSCCFFLFFFNVWKLQWNCLLSM